MAGFGMLLDSTPSCSHKAARDGVSPNPGGFLATHTLLSVPKRMNSSSRSRSEIAEGKFPDGAAPNMCQQCLDAHRSMDSTNCPRKTSPCSMAAKEHDFNKSGEAYPRRPLPSCQLSWNEKYYRTSRYRKAFCEGGLFCQDFTVRKRQGTPYYCYEG